MSESGVTLVGALVGNIGSDDRINYTAMGDVVNTASRLEGVNKQFFTTFMASEVVLAGCKRQAAFVTRYVGEVKLRGKQERLPSHHICGTAYRTVEDIPEASEHDGEGLKVSSVRPGTHSLSEGYASVAAHCYVSEPVSDACSLLSQYAFHDHHRRRQSVSTDRTQKNNSENNNIVNEDGTCLEDIQETDIFNNSSSVTSSVFTASPSSKLPPILPTPSFIRRHPTIVVASKSSSSSTSLFDLDNSLLTLLGPSQYIPCYLADGTAINEALTDYDAFLAMRYSNQQDREILSSLRKDLRNRIFLKERR